jgi:hypothetical protein
MKSTVHTLVAALAALGPMLVLVAGLTGCGEDDLERQAAYPEPIGYTNPSSQPASTGTQAAAPSAAPPPPPAQIPPPPRQGAGDGVGEGEVADGEQPVQPAVGEDYADTDPSALSDFRGALDPYGSWVDDPTYGTIWVPSQSVVGDDFMPYQTAGHWSYDDDYTWVSDYDWGWAPFHYGRWAYAAPYGWGWIPGRVYGGAWVSWRYGYGDWGYVGWAPLGPTWGWRGGVAVGLGFVPAEPYGFCSTGNLFAPHVGEHMIPAGQAGTVGAHTQPYVAATPTTGGHVAATPHVNGPSPQVLGIPASSVVHGALANRGVVQARAYAHASTASTLGAREPQTFASRSPTPSRGLSYGNSYGNSGASHFGGKLGSGFSGSVTNMPHAYGSSYGSAYGRGYGGSYGYSGPSRGGSGLYGGYGGAGPAYRGYGGYGGGPMYGQPGASGKSSGSRSRSSGSSSGEEGYSGGSGGHRGGGGSHGGGGRGGGHR